MKNAEKVPRKKAEFHYKIWRKSFLEYSWDEFLFVGENKLRL